LKSTNNRSKKNGVPNLGDWLILLTISHYSWNDVSREFVEECDARNVFWYVQGTRFNPGKHRELADVTKNNDRVRKVFNVTQISRNLVCFQTRFLESLDRVNLGEFDERFGVVQDDLKNELKGIYNDIVKIKDWNGYFEWNRMPKLSVTDREEQLVQAVKLSEQKGYHGNKGGQRKGGRNNYRRGRRY